MAKVFFNAVAVAMYMTGIVYDYMYIRFPARFIPIDDTTPLQGKTRFLTFWCLLIQTLYFTVALLNDFIGTNENAPSKTPPIRRIKDILFTSLAFPLALYVATTFWGIYMVDRELIFPKVLDEFFPTWLNHLMHTNIAVFILIETFISFRKYPTRKTGLTVLTVFLLCYISWVHVIYAKSGIWVYPILAVLTWPMKVAFYLVSLMFGYFLYLTGEKLNNTIWSKQVAQIVRSGKKKAH